MYIIEKTSRISSTTGHSLVIWMAERRLPDVRPTGSAGACGTADIHSLRVSRGLWHCRHPLSQGQPGPVALQTSTLSGSGRGLWHCRHPLSQGQPGPVALQTSTLSGSAGACGTADTHSLRVSRGPWLLLLLDLQPNGGPHFRRTMEKLGLISEKSEKRQ